MCGITGFVNFEGHDRDAARARVKRMADAIAHRGPDGEGFFVDEFAALGHRRLAIIDVAGGQQPMSACDGQVQIVFNGEIYNFLDIRAALLDHGHSLRTRSDTEVILHAYLEWGPDCIARLWGMFAFAIWDGRSRELFLGRDRVGKKPLYYCRMGSVVAFGSELKSLLAGQLCPTDVDPQALDCYLTYGYIPAPRSIYQGVRKLRAAHSMLLGAKTDSERKYWQLSFAAPRQRSLQDATDELEDLLDEAVQCRLMSEVPLGAFLSGGLDSSLVVASMARTLKNPVITHSIGFEEREFSELPLAREIAAHLKTDHREFVVVPRAADVLGRIAWHFDEPFADSSAVPTWYVCEMARQSVTVALSGDGGDEGFGGYTFRYVPHMLEARLRAGLPAAGRAAVFGTLGRLWPASARLPRPMRLKTIFENLAVGDAMAYFRDLAVLRPDMRTALYRPEFVAALKGFTPAEAVIPFYSHSDAPDALGRSQYADVHFYMTDDVLVKVDRMSMAHSLEVRAPLLDHRLLEFAATLPAHLKIDGRRGKVVLRQLAEQRLPPQILRAPKRGFSIPAARWLRGELRPLVEELAFLPGGAPAEVLDLTRLRALWQEHLNGSRDHSTLFWGVLMLALWATTTRRAS